MSTKIKIKITKEILYASARCGKDGLSAVPSGCAFALAVRDIFPNALVFMGGIVPFLHTDLLSCTLQEMGLRGSAFGITEAMRKFIVLFDKSSYNERLVLPENEFELEIPDWAVDKLAQQEVDFVQAVLNSPTLELIPV